MFVFSAQNLPEGGACINKAVKGIASEPKPEKSRNGKIDLEPSDMARKRKRRRREPQEYDSRKFGSKIGNVFFNKNSLNRQVNGHRKITLFYSKGEGNISIMP